MLAFNNDSAQAEAIRRQVLAHEAADEIIQGRYWENGKGCFIGCIAHSKDAQKAAGILGGDLMLVRIAESIFEGLPNAEAKQFPARVILAPKVGADLSPVPWKFLHWCVGEVLNHAAHAICNNNNDHAWTAADRAANAALSAAADTRDMAADAACAAEREKQRADLIAAFPRTF